MFTLQGRWGVGSISVPCLYIHQELVVSFEILKTKDSSFPQLNFKCPWSFPYHRLVSESPHPHIAHIPVQGGLSCFWRIHASLGIWVLLEGCLLKGKSRLLRCGHLWSPVSWPQLPPFPHFFLLYSNRLFSLQRFYAPPFLLPFSTFLWFGMFPFVGCYSHPVCIFPIPRGPVGIFSIMVILLYAGCGSDVLLDLCIYFVSPRVKQSCENNYCSSYLQMRKQAQKIKKWLEPRY